MQAVVAGHKISHFQYEILYPGRLPGAGSEYTGLGYHNNVDFYFRCTTRIDHNPPTLQTDGQTDGRTSSRISATKIHARRAKNEQTGVKTLSFAVCGENNK